MKKISIDFSIEDLSTQIYLGHDLLLHSFWMEQIKGIASRFALVMDSKVNQLYGNKFLEIIKTSGLDTFPIVIEPGEKQKTRQTKEQVEDALLENNMGRDSAIVSIGGGVVLDLAGFVAATYCRGIPFISIPTTLLSMVDASIGGKTGVNVGMAKNMVGSFHPASLIVIDFSTLQTLPEAELKNGLAEIIKYGLIYNPELINSLREQKDRWQKKDPSFLEKLILLSIEAKQTVIEKDPKEKGLRRILNFGHTVGHAIESALEYRCSHGEAIATGMCIESYLSMKSGLLSKKELDAIFDLFSECGFTLFLSPGISLSLLEPYMMLDKKNSQKQARFVLLSSIGNVQTFDGNYCTTVPRAWLQEAFDWFDDLKTKQRR
jgi:3-dehydroquinate synthase